MRKSKFLKGLFLVLGLCTIGLVVALAAAQARTPGRSENAGFLEPDRNWVHKNMKSMTLRDKVAQLIKIRVPGRFLNRQNAEYRDVEDQIRLNHVGGIILFAGNVY
jgi:hypothetical protein